MNNRFELKESSIKRSQVFSNPVNNMGRSFISTHLAQQSLVNGDDLRKSRISNLPNYRRTNLGETPNFVIVFQTIEIQRLSSQIQVLRVKLKQAQRQLFNAQNYQVQIRQLTQKCFNSENQLYEYREEIEKLNKICEAIYHENEQLKAKLSDLDVSLKQKYQSEKAKSAELQQQIQKWKSRYQAAQKSKAKELEDLRNLMECQRKSMIDRQIREMTIRFQNQRSGLENQIRKSRQMLNNKNYEVEDLKQRCQKYQIQVMEMNNYKTHMDEMENKIALLSQQLVRLNQVLRSKEDKIQQFKKNEYQLNLKLKHQSQLQNQTQQIRGLLEVKNKEVEDWKVRSSRFEDEAIRGKQLVHFNNELNDKLNLTGKQIQRLNNILRQKLQEIEKWKGKVQEKEIEISKLKNLQNELPQYESKNNMLKAENDRINGILKTRLQQIQSWKNRSVQYEGALAKFALLEKDKLVIQDRFNKQIKDHEQLKFAYRKLQNDLNSYVKYQQKCRQIQGTNNGLNREIDRLNGIIRNNSTQINDFRQRFKQLEYTLDQYKNIELQMKDYQNKIILLTQQIQRLNQLIRTKNQDIDQLESQKLELHQKINHYKNYEIKINENEQIVAKLQNNLQIQKRDIQNWQNKFRSGDAKIRQLENQVFQANNDKDRVSSGLRNKMNEFQDLRNRYQNLQAEMRQLNDLKLVCQQQHNQITVYLSDIESLSRKTKQYERQLAKQKTKSQQLGKKMSDITLQFQKVSKQLSGNTMKKAQQFDQLQSQYSRIVSKSKSKDGQIEMLINKCTNLQTQTRKLMEQFVRILKEVEKSENQTQGLYKKIEEYQDYARRISILDAQLSRLDKLNKDLQNDNKQMRLKYSNEMEIQKRADTFNLVRVLMSAQIQSLRSRIQQRQVRQQQMRKSILQPVRRI